MPSKVRPRSGGRNTSRSGADDATPGNADGTAARHRGDSGTAASVKTPIRAGAAPTRSGHRQASSVTGKKYARTPRKTKPKLLAAPSKPASSGRDASGHASLTSATAPGH